MIGSAAVVLHGGQTGVGDVDLLVGVADATTLLADLNLPNIADDDGVFRSEIFGRWSAAPLPIEFMGGLLVRGAPVRLSTRTMVAGVPVPTRTELIALLRQFGRPKDLQRVAALADG